MWGEHLVRIWREGKQERRSRCKAFLSILFWCWAAGPISAYGAGMRASRHTPPKSEFSPSAIPVLGATSGPAVCGRSLTRSITDLSLYLPNVPLSAQMMMMEGGGDWGGGGTLLGKATGVGEPGYKVGIPPHSCHSCHSWFHLKAWVFREGWRIFNHEWARMGTNGEGTVDN